MGALPNSLNVKVGLTRGGRLLLISIQFRERVDQRLYQWSIDAVNVKVIERNLDISWPGYANTVIHRRDCSYCLKYSTRCHIDRSKRWDLSQAEQPTVIHLNFLIDLPLAERYQRRN